MRTFRYNCLHIPSGNRVIEVAKFRGEQEFLEALNRWNRTRIGQYQFWSDT